MRIPINQGPQGAPVEKDRYQSLRELVYTDPIRAANFLLKEIIYIDEALTKLEDKIHLEHDPTLSTADKLSKISDAAVFEDEVGIDEIRHIPANGEGVCLDCINTLKIEGAVDFISYLVKKSDTAGELSPAYLSAAAERLVVPLAEYAESLGFSKEEASAILSR
jgi:hypothetical protein